MHVFVDPAHLTGWESCVWEYVILQNRGLVLAGTILILRTQMLPNLHQYSHDRMSQLLLKLKKRKRKKEEDEKTTYSLPSLRERS